MEDCIPPSFALSFLDIVGRSAEFAFERSSVGDFADTCSMVRLQVLVLLRSHILACAKSTHSWRCTPCLHHALIHCSDLAATVHPVWLTLILSPDIVGTTSGRCGVFNRLGWT